MCGDSPLLTLKVRLLGSERGQGMTEYGLVLALVAVVVISALTALGTGVKGTFNVMAGKV